MLKKTICKLIVLATGLMVANVLLTSHILGQEETPGYNNKIPESILTPDTVETKVGTLEFFDGIPTEKAAALLFDNLDLNRGLQALLNGMPASNFEAGRAGHIALGQEKANQLVIFDGLMDSNSLFLTGNAGTVYATSFLDLERDGPTVVEIPAGTGPGIMVDSFTRNIVDMGPPGPHRGQGGKFLILPPGYDESDFEGLVPQGVYTIASSRSYAVWLLLRGFLKDGKPDYSSQLFRNGIKIYPLSTALIRLRWSSSRVRGRNSTPFTPPATSSTKNSIAVIDREPIEFLDPELRGLFASIGIQKGKPVCPGRADEEDSGASREVGQCDRPRSFLV